MILKTRRKSSFYYFSNYGPTPYISRLYIKLWTFIFNFRSKIQQVASSGIKKQKKTKKVKVESNTEVGEAIKKELTENVAVVPNKMPLRQEKWRSFLQVFLQHEKLNKKQKLIITFCTTKGVTAPRRKKKFLVNYITDSYPLYFPYVSCFLNYALFLFPEFYKELL